MAVSNHLWVLSRCACVCTGRPHLPAVPAPHHLLPPHWLSHTSRPKGCPHSLARGLCCSHTATCFNWGSCNRVTCTTTALVYIHPSLTSSHTCTSVCMYQYLYILFPTDMHITWPHPPGGGLHMEGHTSTQNVRVVRVSTGAYAIGWVQLHVVATGSLGLTVHKMCTCATCEGVRERVRGKSMEGRRQGGRIKGEERGRRSIDNINLHMIYVHHTCFNRPLVSPWVLIVLPWLRISFVFFWIWFHEETYPFLWLGSSIKPLGI